MVDTPRKQPAADAERSLKDEVAVALDMSQPADGPRPDEISIAEARRQKTLRRVASNRTSVRMLFITSDTDVLQPGTPSQQHYADLAQFIGELHVIVLVTGRSEVTVMRPMRNVWVYRVPGKHTWQQVWHARQTALSHLRFNGVVQPDVIVATDPLTAGMSAWLIARALRRPWQVHIHTNYFSVEWFGQSKRHKRLLWVVRFVLRRTASVRTRTEALVRIVRQQLPDIEDVATLPRLFNLAAYRTPHEDTLHTQYHQHPFIIMAEGEYQADSALHDVFAAVHTLLQQGRVALLIRGSGRARHLFEAKADLLGVREQVIFESSETDPVSRYQGADIFIEADTTTAGDERFLRAIASTTPVVAYRNDFREDVIVDGESGFLCEPGDSFALGKQVRTLYNDSARRQQFAMRARNVAEDQIHEDVPTYFMAFRDTITAVIREDETSV